MNDSRRSDGPNPRFAFFGAASTKTADDVPPARAFIHDAHPEEAHSLYKRFFCS
jgi:hypothetical protein